MMKDENDHSREKRGSSAVGHNLEAVNGGTGERLQKFDSAKSCESLNALVTNIMPMALQPERPFALNQRLDGRSAGL
jgi:hypothetical protein